jgi:hypothetical protein
VLHTGSTDWLVSLISRTGKIQSEGNCFYTRMRIFLQLKQRSESRGKSTGININLFPISRTFAAAVKKFTASNTYLNYKYRFIPGKYIKTDIIQVLCLQSTQATARATCSNVPNTHTHTVYSQMSCHSPNSQYFPQTTSTVCSPQWRRNVFCAVRTEFLCNI